MAALPAIDYPRHNDEVRRVWEAYHAGRPIRVPVGPLGINTRTWLLDPRLNTEGITWEAFTKDPDLMFDTVLRSRHHIHHHIIQDIEMGVPEEGWLIHTDFVNVTEAAWLGCPVVYRPGQVSATVTAYHGDRGNAVIDRGIPGPFDGIMGTIREYYEHFVERARAETFCEKPIRVMHPTPLITDGPLTVALDIRGHEVLTDMYDNPGYYHRLMDFLTTAIIQRIRAWREYLGIDPLPAAGGFADDAIQMLSIEAYREHVLPYHRRLYRELLGSGPHSMHICGNVQRHFPTLIRELNIKSFDTGYPINFESLRDEIGEDVEIRGGVRIDILLNGSADDVTRETRRILESGVMRGGRFILTEANNLPPCVPLGNLHAMHQTARTCGVY